MAAQQSFSLENKSNDNIVDISNEEDCLHPLSKELLQSQSGNFSDSFSIQSEVGGILVFQEELITQVQLHDIKLSNVTGSKSGTIPLSDSHLVLQGRDSVCYQLFYLPQRSLWLIL